MTEVDHDRPVAWQAQSLLLSYPDERVIDNAGLVRTIAERLPETYGAGLIAFLTYLSTTPPAAVAAEYVATFDHRKRFSPYLTYFAYGDTRKRGMALLRFKHAYQSAGMRLDDGELPDHIAVVLEFAASGNSETGLRLLCEHRAGLELMRRGLQEHSSPWAPVLDSVSATLPALGKRDRKAMLALAEAGPPEEEVGLAPFAPPEYMPARGVRR
ncbi:nitrate reductase molybdenum cofactor assembly chaperone [Prauserella marina]|uniref:Nitrate reductase delta subunit n=1 Tax=Prauserella marina TaxID=530584 RepID=A0A222VQW7_9PSEU|nr:nitrate reductase molybdenum cofactor assembly chaperone [Prauserella marina]ASR36133.1 nitrate reductase molybdenum cofactor assembly chaperone [Prauserella marina]PWV76870.1 respiratory nitrate reductase chaperone NarJ [Prauserella marina]SDC99396.1 nitrate reductase delta subunit [Prauserella marina]